MANDVLAVGNEFFVREPADHRLNILGNFRRVVGLGDGVATGNIDLVLQRHHHRHRGESLGEFAGRALDGFDARGQAGGLRDDRVARLENSARHATGKATEIVVLIGVGPDHGLDRETGVDVIHVAADVNSLQRVEQRAALVPRHLGRTIDDVVSVQRRDGNKLDVGNLQAGGELGVGGDNLIKPGLGVVDEVHFVHADHHVRDTQQRSDEGVAAGLLDDALARVDQDDGKVGG